MKNMEIQNMSLLSALSFRLELKQEILFAISQWQCDKQTKEWNLVKGTG